MRLSSVIDGPSVGMASSTALKAAQSNTDRVSVDYKDDGNFIRCRLCRKG